MPRKFILVLLFLMFSPFFMLPQACHAPECINNISSSSLNPNGSFCETTCDCNNQNYEGSCQDGVCVSKRRLECQEKGAKGTCDLPKYAQKGKCKVGVKICQDKGLKTKKWGDCHPFNVLKHEDKAMLCFDHLDNDCDGYIDEFDEDCKNFCRPGTIQPCYSGDKKTYNVGNCRAGKRRCQKNGTWGKCEGEILPASKEICDGFDEDCNGIIDDNCQCKPGTTENCYSSSNILLNKGICKAGTHTCRANGSWGPCLGEVLPHRETCNRKDDDCDGKVDEDIDCRCKVPGEKEPCYSGPLKTLNIGVCSTGIRLCGKNYYWGECQGERLPTAEICDGRDNDCDGKIDEGCPGTPCQKNSDCSTYRCDQKKGICIQSDLCDPQCQGGKICKEGRCLCPKTMTECSGICVDLQKNNQHCGQCGHRCLAAENCVQGRCEFVCPKGQTFCNNQCFDLKTSFFNCGRCGHVCESNEFCQNGQCVQACPAKTRICGRSCCPENLNCCQGRCIDTRVNSQHCGGCGIQCQRGELCCPQKNKMSQCINIFKDPDNCGLCGHRCAQGQVCCQGTCIDLNKNPHHCGQCGQSCAVGDVCCQGQCADRLNDPLNCGTCGHRCASDEKCCAGHCKKIRSDAQNCGACGSSCPVNASCCGGLCVFLKHDAQNCGACGKICSHGQICCQGKCANIFKDPKNCGACGIACRAGETCCQGKCVNLKTDKKNCNICGNACPNRPNIYCCSGRCVDIEYDKQNCGSCGHSCAKYCVAGICK